MVGWAANSAGILNAGLFMIASGWLGFGASTLIGRRRLRARAESSLIARAELRRLELTDGMAARLHLFDDAWSKLQASLTDPSLPGAEVSAQVAAVQDELFRLAERHATVSRELSQLGLYSASDMIETTRQDKRAELARLEAEAEELVRETRALAATADQVRALASGRATEATDALKDAVSQFNLTLAAYREVEAHTRAKTSAARASQAQSQSA